MRVTNNLMVRDQLAALQGASTALLRSQRLVSSGVRVAALSDDPSAGRDIMAADSRLRAIAQYERGLDAAAQRVDTQDQVLRQMSGILTRAQELAVAGVTGTQTAETRRVLGREVEALFGELVALGNTTVEGEYLFGGERGAEMPFTQTGSGNALGFTTTGASGVRAIEIDAGRLLAPTDDGATMFLDSDVLEAVRALSVALHSPGGTQAEAIAAAGRRVSQAMDRTQTLTGGLGGRAATLELVRANLGAFEGSLQALRSKVRDVDIEAAATELVTRQNAYQAALLASSKVLGLNLADYLR